MTHASDSSTDICVEAGLREAHRHVAACGYWNAFSRKLRYPLGPREKAIAFIDRVIDPNHAISAVSGSGEFLGVAGFKTPKGAFVGGTLTDLVQVYGRFGACLRGGLVSMLERSCEMDTLLMDGIFVQPDARGRGVGTTLLLAVERHAQGCGLKRIRLDVIDTNPRARTLYERQGFVERAVHSLGPFAPVFGFSHAAEMTKSVGS